jgi:hypothetical protein
MIVPQAKKTEERGGGRAAAYAQGVGAVALHQQARQLRAIADGIKQGRVLLRHNNAGCVF